MGQRFLSITILIFTFIVSIPIKAKSHYYLSKNFVPYQAIIVPGAPIVKGRLNPIVLARIKWAVLLYKLKKTKKIIFSGAAVYSPYVECEIMKQIAIQNGVDSADILIENKARHSTENVFYGFLLAQKHNLNRVAVATDPMQGAMIKWFMPTFKKHMGFRVDVLIFRFKYVHDFKVKHKIYKTETSFIDDFVPIQKNESLIQRIQGTFGKQIPWPKADTESK